MLFTNSEPEAETLAGRFRHDEGMKMILVSLLFVAPLIHAAEKIPNQLIDYSRFRQIAANVEPVRERHRLSEAQFIAMAAEPGTVMLDARSADKFALRHI